MINSLFLPLPQYLYSENLGIAIPATGNDEVTIWEN